jgi:hypothetical protein
MKVIKFDFSRITSEKAFYLQLKQEREMDLFQDENIRDEALC